MKINKLFIILMVALQTFMLQSCLKDDSQVFSTDSSLRMQEYLDNTKSVLTKDGGQWLMEMYPEEEQSYGGYAFTLQFNSDSVTVQSEIASSSSKAYTSLWKTTNDDGPVLTFDSYNTLLHNFATPSSSAYEGFNGEFEWIIMDVQDDQIKLKGKKTGNYIYMYRLNEDPTTYLDKMSAIENSIIMTGAQGTIGGKQVVISLDGDSRQAEIQTADDDVTVAYCMTSTGLRLYKDVDVNGKTVRSFKINVSEDGNSTGLTSEYGDVLTAVFPEGWRSYDAYPGKYILSFYTYGLNAKKTGYTTVAAEPIDITITANGDGSTYTISGLSPKADITATYKKSKGAMEIVSQPLGKLDNGDYVYLCAWGLASGGNLTWSDAAGMVSVWDGNEANPTYTFTDNGDYSITIDSFILWELDSTGSSVGVLTDTSWNFNGGIQGSPYGNRLPYFNHAKLVKVSEEVSK